VEPGTAIISHIPLQGVATRVCGKPKIDSDLIDICSDGFPTKTPCKPQFRLKV